LRQSAIEEQQRLADRERQIRLQNLQIQEAERRETEAKESKEVREDNAQSYKDLGVPDALVNDYVAGNITAAQMNTAYSQSLSARAKSVPEYRPVSGQALDNVKLAMEDNEAVQELLSIKGEPKGIVSQYLPFFRDSLYSEQDFIAEVSMIRQVRPDLNESQAVDMAVSTLPAGGILSTIARTDPETAESFRTQIVRSVQPMGVVNQTALAAGSGLETTEPGLTAPESAAQTERSIDDLLAQVEEFQAQQGSAPSGEAPVVNEEELALGFISRNRPQARSRIGQSIADTAAGLAREYMEGRERQRDIERQRQDEISQIMSSNNVSREEAYNIYIARETGRTRDAAPAQEQQTSDLSLDDVLGVIERKNFPMISTAAGQARSLPDYVESLGNLTRAVLSTIQSRESISGAIDAGMKNTLRATGALVEKLAEGQDVNVINSIERNVERMEQKIDDIVLPLQLKRELQQSIIAYRNIVNSAKQNFGIE
jgi:hypothetical protein